MAAIDLLACGAILLFAILGALSGALVQLARLVAIAASIVLGRPAGALLAPLLADGLGLSPKVAGFVGTGLAFAAIYLVFHLGGRLFAKAVTEDREIRAVDRAAGALLAAAQATLAIWVLLSALALLGGPAERLGVKLSPDGFFAGLARDHGFFDVALPEPEAAEPQASRLPASSR